MPRPPSQIADAFGRFLSRHLGGAVGRQLLQASALVALLTMASRGVTAARDIVVAWDFGIGDILDSYFMALMITQFFTAVYQASFSGAFTPSFIWVGEKQGRDAAARLLGSATAAVLLGLGILTIVLIVLAPAYLPVLASGFSPAKLHLTFDILLMLSPLVLITGLVTLWGAAVNAGGRYTLPALTPGLNAGISLAALLLFGKIWGIHALAAGIVVGAGSELLVLGLQMRRHQLRVAPLWTWREPGLTSVWRQLLPAVTTGIVMAGMPLMDQAMAASLGPSNVSALSLGSKVTYFLSLVFAGSLFATTITFASNIVASGRSAEFVPLAKRLTIGAMAATGPIALLLFLFAEPLIALLLQHGAFSAADSRLVGAVQAAYALYLPFYVVYILYIRMIAALQANTTILQSACMMFVAKLALNYVLMRHFGVVGIAGATAIVYLLVCIFLYRRVCRLALAR